MRHAAPSFDEWVNFCFTQRCVGFSSNSQEADERAAQLLNLDPSLVAEYLTRLFRDPIRLSRDFSRKQLAEGVWFIFSSSGYARAVVLSRLPAHVVVDFYDALGDLYVNLFDQICSHEEVELFERDYRPDPLDIAVFMIWDMDGIEYGVMTPDGHDEIVDAGFRTLERVLTECQTSTCQESALHGLGHLLSDFEDRSTAIIERFLESKSPPKHVVEYALEAREGHV